MAFKATIAGVDQTTSLKNADAVSISLRYNERSEAQVLGTARAGLVPARFADVVLYAIDGTTPLFGGMVLKPDIAGWGDGEPLFETGISCVDYFTLLEWTFPELTYTSPVTLKAVLTDLVAALPVSYGITLHGSQVTGPTLDPFTKVGDQSAADIIRELSGTTQYVSTMSPTKVLRMQLPGATSAPFAITTASPHCKRLDWSYADTTPANRIVLVCGPTGTAVRTQTWTIVTGTETTFDVDIAAANVSPISVVTITRAATPPFYATVGSGAMFEWDSTAGTGPGRLTVGTLASFWTLTAGDILSYDYEAIYPFTKIATASATPEITARIVRPDITDPGFAQAAADATLAQRNQSPKRLRFISKQHGWSPGQLLTVDLAVRGLTLSAIIMSVEVRLVTGAYWEYTVEAEEQITSDILTQPTYIDNWRDVLGSSASTAIVSSGGGGTVTVLSAPFPLGGIDQGTLPSATATTYTPIVNFQKFVAPGTFTALIRVDLWARVGAVDARAELFDVTDSAQVGESSAVGSTTRAGGGTTFFAPVIEGHEYILRAKTNTANTPPFAIGTLEAAA